MRLMKKFNLFLVIFFIICVFSIYKIRMKTIWIFLVIVIISIVKKQYKTTRLCVIFCTVLLALDFYPLHESVEKVRFSIVEQAYTKQAKLILNDEKRKVNITNKRDKIKISNYYAQDGHAIIYRKEEYISVYFPTRVTFFNSSGFFYCEDKLNFNQMEGMEKNDTLLALSGYDRIEVINEHWAYVKVY